METKRFNSFTSRFDDGTLIQVDRSSQEKRGSLVFSLSQPVVASNMTEEANRTMCFQTLASHRPRLLHKQGCLGGRRLDEQLGGNRRIGGEVILMQGLTVKRPPPPAVQDRPAGAAQPVHHRRDLGTADDQTKSRRPWSVSPSGRGYRLNLLGNCPSAPRRFSGAND